MGSKAKWRVVVTDYNYPDLSIEEQELARWDAQVIPAQCRTPEEVLAVAKEADALISQYAPITREVIYGLKNCKAIGRYGIGVDNIDVQAATERGIAVINVPSYCEEEVSDHTLAFILAWARKIVHYNTEIRQGVWDWKSGRPIRRLQGQTLGLLGFGKIAKLVAKKAKCFGFKVIAYDPYVPNEIFTEVGVEKVEFDQLLKESDFISIHLPLTANTYHIINEDALAKLKPTACLINTSRGGVIDEKALITALKEKRIAGACLDVTDPEPPSSDNPLLSMPQVLLSPHVAWYSEESQADLRKKIATDIGRALWQVMPDGLVNQELAKKFKTK
jgi:D-3-phosphoglycerate dehydrogenase